MMHNEVDYVNGGISQENK